MVLLGRWLRRLVPGLSSDVQSGSEVWGQPQASLPPSAAHPHTCECFHKSLLICGSYSGSVLTA